MTPPGPPLRCRECGLELPPRAAHGHCPHCLLSLALGTIGDPGDGPEPITTPRRILGGHELLTEIASGGMGVVWKARQLELNRLVALKTLHAGSLASPSARLRFRIEVEAVARLDHPNIVSLFETGESDGVHFYTMTLVEGGDLAQLLADAVRRPPLRDRIELLVRVARAVDYAHQRGILHRDLKPSNVLIDTRGQPLIADFGLARPLLIETDLTLTGTILGSPHYMAPEQARGDPALLSTAVDVYSLGAMLYEVVALRPPFVADSPLGVLELARTAEPTPPGSAAPRQDGLTRTAARDLDTIVLKCLRKQPGERYLSARELAEELERWLDGRPILARPVPALEQAWRWCRREPALAGALATAGLLVLALAGGAFLHAWRMDQARQRIAAQAGQLAFRNTDLRLREAAARFSEDQSAKAVATLAGLVRADPSNRVASTRLLSALRLRSFGRAAFYPIEHPREVTAALIRSAPRPLLVTCAEDGLVRWWNPADGAAAEEPLRVGSAGALTAVSPEGDRLVAAEGNQGALRDLTTRRQLGQFAEGSRVVGVRFGPDGAEFLTVTDRGVIQRRSASTGEPISDPIETGETLTEVFLPDGTPRRVVALTTGGAVRVWDAVTGRSLWEQPAEDSEPPRLATSSDGTRVAIAVGNSLRLLALTDGRELGRALPLPGRVEQLCFSPDGALLAAAASGPSGHVVALLGRDSFGAAPVQLRHRQEVRAMDFSRDSRRLLTASGDGVARVWNTTDGRPEGEPLLHSAGVHLARFGRDEREVVTACFGAIVWVWHLPGPGRTVTAQLGEPVVAAVFDPAGRYVAAGGFAGQVALWKPGTGEPAEALPAHTARIWHLEFSADGRWLASAGGDGRVRLREVATHTERELTHAGRTWVMSARFDASGERLVTAGHDRRAVIWEVRTARRILELPHPEGVNDAVFSPDGRFVLTRSNDDRARLWDARTGRLLTDELRHSSWVDAALFVDEGRRVVTGSRDTTLALWAITETPPAGRGPARLAEVRTPAPMLALALNPSGALLAAVRGDQTVELRLPAGLGAGPVLVHQHPVFMAEFARDGTRLVTAAGAEGARVWDAHTGHPLSESLTSTGMVFVARFHPDGRSVLTAGEDGTLHLWPAEPAASPAPPWLPDLAETTVVLREDASGGFTQLGVKTWPQLTALWGDRSEFRSERESPP